MRDTLITVIMPTYNSEATIKYSLDSIQNQSFDLSRLECLVIDGGSSDRTREIASRYFFTKIIENPKRLPEFAKLIGFKKANGKYIIKMDSDEMFERNDALECRIKAFEMFPDSHILIADELKPCGSEISNSYINYCGDPFSYFIYKPQKTILKTYKKNIANKNGEICLLKFKEEDVRPIADGGTTTFDRDFILDNFDESEINVSFISSVSDKILDITNACICIENDSILHRSKGDLNGYLKKIKFRITNNIFPSAQSGFSNRKISASRKKLLFPFYTVSFILPLFDSIKLSVSYRDKSFMLHIFYCYYTLILIVWYYLLKILNLKKSNKEY